MNREDQVLFPRPQRWRRTGEHLELGLRVSLRAPEVAPAAAARRWLEGVFSALGHVVEPGGDRPDIELVLEGGGQPQHYSIEVTARGVHIRAADEAGLFYGAVTLGQWLRHQEAGEGSLSVPGLWLEDGPAFAVRGALLDVSRDKVPTLETLFALVDRLAGWKLNQLQLYFEHPFTYRGHEVVWKDASAYSAEDLRRLDAYCRERCVELVPNQNSFGHLHRWLRHEPYRQLAECPQGVKHPFGEEIEPFSLCPGDPGSLELLADLYDQLLPNFESGLLNVGCDETFDLGLGRSASECEERGKEKVYLEFLKQVHGLVSERGKRMLFWGDIIIERPELIAELPPDAIALEWGYEADHPFAEHGALFADSGLDFYVCPGTSSWNSIAGRSSNAVANLAAAARHGKAHGAAGYLITDWGDFGHLQPLPVSCLGLLAGAGFAWNATVAEEPESLDFPALLDSHVFDGEVPGLGEVAWDLGEVYKVVGAVPKNGSALFFLLIFAGETLEHRRFEGLSSAGLERALRVLSAGREALQGLGCATPEAELLREEFLWAADLLTFAAHLGVARLEAGRAQPLVDVPAATRARLQEELSPLLQRHRKIWLERNRPGGLDDSQSRLRALEVALGS